MEYKFWFGVQSSLSWDKFNCGVLTERRVYNGEEFEANDSMSKMLGDAINDWIDSRDDASDCGRCEEITCDQDMRELMGLEIEWFSEWINTDGNDLDDIFEFNEDLPEILFDYNEEMDMNHLKQAFTHGRIGEIYEKLPPHSLYLINKKKVETWDDINDMWHEACDDWNEYCKVVGPHLWEQEKEYVIPARIHKQQEEDFSNALLARIIWEQLRLSKAEVNIVFEY
jgi:hypothetical protein